MLDMRHYAPTSSELIFHYCPPDAFLAICATKTLRFSDIFTMNDYLEMRWAYRIWTSAWPKLTHIPRDFIKKLDRTLFLSGFRATPLACCFSLDGDVLSQWRAYAADGVGFSIGFQAHALTALPARPLRVLYDESQQTQELTAIVSALYETEKDATEKDSAEFHDFCLHLMLDFAAFKNPAFKEEREIRLLHALRFEPSGTRLKLSDPGGVTNGAKSAPEHLYFGIRNGIPLPRVDLDYSLRATCSPIRKVVIGPKNDSRVTAISVFLETLGHPDVEVAASAASYR